jgi:hypothetical protein
MIGEEHVEKYEAVKDPAEDAWSRPRGVTNSLWAQTVRIVKPG